MSRATAFFTVVLAFLLGCSALPVSSAAATPQYFETAIVEDTDADFAGNSALDIVAVYVSEKFVFDPEKKILKGPHLLFRIELAGADNPPCGSTLRYDVVFNVDGAVKNVTAVVTADSPQNSCTRLSGQGGTAPVQFLGPSLVLAVPSAVLGVVPGSVISDVWAYSSISTPIGQAVQDVAPQDNTNAPSGQPTKPGGDLKSYTAIGVYEFLAVTNVTPTEQFSVNGGEVEYVFQFFSHQDLKDDNIRVRFTIPDGWTVSPSRGSTGADPEGQLSGGSGGQPVEFSFTTSATGVVNEGDVATIVMDVITDAGGYKQITTQTTVSGSKVTDPNLTFDLTSKGPFTAEETTLIRFNAAHPTIDLAGETLSIDVYSGTRKITTLVAKPMGGGVYEVPYSFPGEGEYRLDVHISSMKPSPHQEFTVNVEKGGLAPGPGFLAVVLVALLGVAAYLRRQA